MKYVTPVLTCLKPMTRFIRPILVCLVYVVALVVVVAAVTYHSRTAPPVAVVLTGRVTAISPFTPLGDGHLDLYVRAVSHRYVIVVNVVGLEAYWAADGTVADGQTKWTLKSVRYADQLVGHTIRVHGTLENNQVTADTIEEIPNATR